MSKDILGPLRRTLIMPKDRYNLVRDFAHKLSGSEGEKWMVQRKKFLRMEPTWITGEVAASQVPTEPATPEPLLELMDGNIPVGATTARFIAKNKFKLKKDGGICSYLGDNFKNWFLKGEGKIEELFIGGTFCSRKLLRNSLDAPIIKELDDKEKAESSLTEMYSLMAKQSNGENGALSLIVWNIFYIPDSKGVLRAVNVGWDGGGWDVFADSVLRPGDWSAGYLIFSRNSTLKSLETSVPAQA